VPDAFAAPESRCHLYRLLGEPQRLRLLALAAIEELSVGELAELISEPQPNVSRHITPLRHAGLLFDRHQGTRVYVRLADAARNDPVVSDALKEGHRLCEQGGSLHRIPSIIAARELRTRAYFAEGVEDEGGWRPAMELPAYAMALSMVTSGRGIAIDVGTGNGALLDLLAPTYERVVAADRSSSRIEHAKERAANRGYANVQFVCADIEHDTAFNSISSGADALFASRMLHHASSPRASMAAMSRLIAPNGQICIVDYCCHCDEEMRDQRADVWMGFTEDQLAPIVGELGLVEFQYKTVPSGYIHSGFDAHIPWFVATARRPAQ
jgi:DNA-binding transcriptional ArsR family regulator